MISSEGYTAEEINALPDAQVEAFVFTDEPLIIRIGTAEILGAFRLCEERLVVELAQIEGGGEGVLLLLWRLVEQYARRRGLHQVDWVVHAVHCARPNLKLRRVLECRGFVVRDVEGYGPAYHSVQHLQSCQTELFEWKPSSADPTTAPRCDGQVIASPQQSAIWRITSLGVVAVY
jgi:hypothetical protein